MRQRLRLVAPAVGGAACAVLLLASQVMAACDRTEAVCGPAVLHPSGKPLEFYFAVGPCSPDANIYATNWRVTFYGPNNYQFSPRAAGDVFNNTTPVVTGQDQIVPYPGTYAMQITTYTYVRLGGGTCTEGLTTLYATVSGSTVTPQPVPTPVPPRGTPRPTAKPIPTPYPTPYYPLPAIGIVPVGPAMATQQLPVRGEPDGPGTGIVIESGEVLAITGAPVVSVGRFWYPVTFKGIDGFVAAGTGTDPWLVPSARTGSAAPTDGLASPTPAPSVATGSGSPQGNRGSPTLLIIAALIGAAVVVLLASRWALAPGASDSAVRTDEDWICRSCRAINRSGQRRCHGCSQLASDVAVPLSDANALLGNDP